MSPCLLVSCSSCFEPDNCRFPYIQPNATIKHWITAILLFDFKLVHTPAKEHKGPDGLSRRRRVEGDLEEQEGEAEDWLDELLDMGVWVNS